MVEKINEINEAITVIARLFYRQDYSKGFEAFQVLLGELIGIMDALSQDAKYASVFNIQNFSIILGNAMNALELKDAVLLADILTFDLSPELSGILQGAEA